MTKRVRFDEETSLKDQSGEDSDEVEKNDTESLISDQDEDADVEPHRSLDQVKITPFNMKHEYEEGKFDQDGTFIPTPDADAAEDRWLEGIGEAEIRAAHRAVSERAAVIKVEKNRLEGVSEDELINRLKEFMEPGETVAEALRRRGSTAKRWSSKKEKSAGTSNLAEQVKKRELGVITELCNALMEYYSRYDIYEECLLIE